MIRPRIARIATALLVSLLLGSVVPGFSEGVEESTSPGPEVLRIGTPNLVKTANIFSDYYLGIFAHVSNPPLMKMTDDGTIAGQTAEGFSTSEDNTVWTFRIRDDLVWSDGTPVTPEDIRFSIEYTGRNNPNAGWIDDTLEDTAVEGNRVILTFTKPYTGLDLEFATYNILPKHLWESVEDPMGTQNPALLVGCGPFVIDTVDLDAGVVRFSRNPYWNGPDPALEGFEIHLYRNLEVLSLALEKGEVDTYYKYASSYPYSGVERLEKAGGFDFVETPNLGLVFLGFNLKHGPSSDPTFRQAVAHALDYREILELDGMGYGQVPSRGFVAPSMGGFIETEPLERAPDASRGLLSGAGYTDADDDGMRELPDGDELELEVMVRSDWARVGELVVDYLREVGVKAKLRSVELESWVAAKDAYEYDLTVTRTTPWGMLMHAGWGTGYFDARRTGRGVLHTVEDQEFLTLADEILATADPEERLRLGGLVQEYYAEQLPAVALYWNTVVTPFSREYTGWRPDPLYGIYNIDTFLNLRTVDE